MSEVLPRSIKNNRNIFGVVFPQKFQEDAGKPEDGVGGVSLAVSKCGAYCMKSAKGKSHGVDKIESILHDWYRKMCVTIDLETVKTNSDLPQGHSDWCIPADNAADKSAPDRIETSLCRTKFPYLSRRRPSEDLIPEIMRWNPSSLLHALTASSLATRPF